MLFTLIPQFIHNILFITMRMCVRASYKSKTESKKFSVHFNCAYEPLINIKIRWCELLGSNYLKIFRGEIKGTVADGQQIILFKKIKKNIHTDVQSSIPCISIKQSLYPSKKGWCPGAYYLGKWIWISTFILNGFTKLWKVPNFLFMIHGRIWND